MQTWPLIDTQLESTNFYVYKLMNVCFHGSKFSGCFSFLPLQQMHRYLEIPG